MELRGAVHAANEKNQMRSVHVRIADRRPASVAQGESAGDLQDVASDEGRRPQGKEPSWGAGADAWLRQPLGLLHGLKLSEVGWEGGRHHGRGKRHRQGDSGGVRQERRQGRPRRRPGRTGPRRRGRARPRRGLLHPLRRHRRGAGRSRGRPRRGAPRPPGRHVQQRRRRGLPGAAPAGRARPRRLRRRHGDQRPGRDGRGQARRARHGPAPQRQHHLHGQHRGCARQRDAAPVQCLQGGGGGARARRGRGAGALRGARQRHLAQLHPDAVGDAHPGRVVPEGDRRAAPADRGERHQRDGRAGAGGGGRGEGRVVPGVRRGQVRERPQPRRRRRVHGGEAAEHAGTGAVRRRRTDTPYMVSSRVCEISVGALHCTRTVSVAITIRPNELYSDLSPGPLTFMSELCMSLYLPSYSYRMT